MNPISSLVFVLLLTVFPTQILCQTPFVEQICGYTIYKVLCLDTLQSDPGSKSATLVHEIATIALTHTVNKANEIHTQFIDLKNSAMPGGLKLALSTCSDYYFTVADKLSAASFHLSYSNYNLVKARMTEATVNRQKCDQVFQIVNLKSPLSESTTKLSQMQNNAEVIINLL
ncbi:pectinesterase inhibitor [Quercus suber]|uniref:Pectinesterase inhibitor n=1 Tax=Quercus suber TaxID=58331 RepID=A0AAW0JXX1_QUESU|nr:pectinesterase inhibitor-like [Quercus suber]POE73213.1 pectinesterase inhibitor [Quercus suber]